MDTVKSIEGIHGYYLEDLSVGMSAVFAKTVTEADIVLFSGISGDMNPIHVNESYAKETMFGRRIAHGMLTGSMISTVLGMKLPGPGCIYVSQSLNFLAPVYAGDTVEVEAKIIEIIKERKRIICHTTAHVEGNMVVEGEAIMKVRTRG